eukprot:CAMPEP_0184311418 /NCGR_PEP_ID=MMETSP1049-20130417/41881_1 /TAXON_ID=77928 /ORGANISM="Proteomonas sulcata, Strain CCMP704" /LENGTH=204 /DNA_ID=CAMNT_0026626783 /DNA_START=71 /DNA_END=681 /DNA_ORIENTATION=+
MMRGMAWAATAVAVLALCMLAASQLGSVSRVELREDDVMHDSAMNSMGFAHKHQARGRSLRADSSIQDFFKAAMNGDFQKGSAVRKATSGLFSNQPHQHEKLRTTSRARKQQLSDATLRIKAAHAALAQEARASRGRVHEAYEHQVAEGVARKAAARRYATDARMMKEAAKKYPTEDKFVARYTGGIPNGDVVVDSILPNPYMP